jgi:trans-aconitate 2-methyltransferase
VGPLLRARWPGRRIVGIDASPAMAAKAREAGCYSAIHEADAGLWAPEATPALIFSNAALHWLGDHEMLFPRLASLIAPRGMLAVQMPHQSRAPSHRLLREIAADMFPDRFDIAAWRAPVAEPQAYLRLLMPFGQVDAWETVYLQRLLPDAAGHPVRRFTESTAMRPFLGFMSASEQAAFVSRYEAALGAAYATETDGAVLFPFRRLFVTLAR